MEPICPEFPNEVREGDIIIAGKNFGCGSSRERAPRNLKDSGIRAIVAGSFARIFFRSSIALGLPALSCPEAVSVFKQGDIAIIDVEAGTITNETIGKTIKGEVLSSTLITMLKDGGLISLLKRN
jgi:3-isopropylmalate/(R)-2-methylmalate dehydratase small subunit